MMNPRGLAIAALAVLLLVMVAWWSLERRDAVTAPSAGLMLPELAARTDALERIELRVAGGRTAVDLVRVDGEWRMPARTGWPANQRRIGDALRLLAEARRIEAKTADPARWSRLGLEDVAAEDAKGAELVLSGGGDPLRVVIGGNHPSLGGSYVRVGADPQAWLLDADIEPAREPALWLDRRLVDIPVARVARVRIAATGARPFELVRADDGFGLDGLPPQALGNPDAAMATAGFAEPLQLEDVAADDGEPAPTLIADIATVDGIDLTVTAWRQDDITWARLSANFDAARAQAWLAQGGAADADSRLATLRLQVEGWQERWQGRRFRLPAQKAELLWRTREEYLADRR